MEKLSKAHCRPLHLPKYASSYSGISCPTEKYWKQRDKQSSKEKKDEEGEESDDDYKFP